MLWLCSEHAPDSEAKFFEPPSRYREPVKLLCWNIGFSALLTSRIYRVPHAILLPNADLVRPISAVAAAFVMAPVLVGPFNFSGALAFDVRIPGFLDIKSGTVDTACDAAGQASFTRHCLECSLRYIDC